MPITEINPNSKHNSSERKMIGQNRKVKLPYIRGGMEDLRCLRDRNEQDRDTQIEVRIITQSLRLSYLGSLISEVDPLDDILQTKR